MKPRTVARSHALIRWSSRTPGPRPLRKDYINTGASAGKGADRARAEARVAFEGQNAPL